MGLVSDRGDDEHLAVSREVQRSAAIDLEQIEHRPIDYQSQTVPVLRQFLHRTLASFWHTIVKQLLGRLPPSLIEVWGRPYLATVPGPRGEPPANSLRTR